MEGYKKNWSYSVSALLNWDSQQGRDRNTSTLVLAFWNLKLKVLKCQWNFRPHAWFLKIWWDPSYVYQFDQSFDFPGPSWNQQLKLKVFVRKSWTCEKKGSISCTVRQHELKSSLKEQTKPNEIQRVWQKLYYCLQQQQPIPKTAHFLISRSKIVKRKVHKVKDAISKEIVYHL